MNEGSLSHLNLQSPSHLVEHIQNLEIISRTPPSPLSMLENGKMYSCVRSKFFINIAQGWGGAKCVQNQSVLTNMTRVVGSYVTRVPHTVCQDIYSSLSVVDKMLSRPLWFLTAASRTAIMDVCLWNWKNVPGLRENLRSYLVSIKNHHKKLLHFVILCLNVFQLHFLTVDDNL